MKWQPLGLTIVDAPSLRFGFRIVSFPRVRV